MSQHASGVGGEANEEDPAGALDFLAQVVDLDSDDEDEDQTDPPFVVFIDELPMPKRPAVNPSNHDREVFVTNLPHAIFTEEEVREWLGSTFGHVQRAHVLFDIFGAPTGKGYIRFQDHNSAAMYIQAEVPYASWSESERALQQSHSVYGTDLHAAFAEPDGRTLKSLLAQCGVKALWTLSEVQRPSEVQGHRPPRASGEQLHFISKCQDDAECDDVKQGLTFALERFHEWITLRLRRTEAAARWKPRGEPPPVSRHARALERIKRGEPPKGESKPGPNFASGLTWDPATGQYVEEDLPDEVQELIGVKKEAKPDQNEIGPWAWAEEKVSVAAVKAEIMEPTIPVRGFKGPSNGKGGQKGTGKAWPAVVPPPGKGKDKAYASAAAPSGPPSMLRCKMPPPEPPGTLWMTRDPGVDPPGALWVKRDSSVDRGEELVKAGRSLAEVGQLTRAVYKYRTGLKYLMDATPDAYPDEPRDLTAQRRRISTYLGEMERLTQQAGERAGGSASESTTEQAPVDRAEVLMREGRAAASRGQDAHALEKYRTGLQQLFGDAPDSSACGTEKLVSHRKRMGAYLAEMEALRARVRHDPHDSKSTVRNDISWTRGTQKKPSSSPEEENEELQRRIGACEATMRDAHVLEEMGMRDEAQKRYDTGLQDFRAIVTELGQRSPDGEALKSKFGFCLAGAVTLKGLIDRAGMCVITLPNGLLAVRGGAGVPPRPVAGAGTGRHVEISPSQSHPLAAPKGGFRPSAPRPTTTARLPDRSRSRGHGVDMGGAYVAHAFGVP